MMITVEELRKMLEKRYPGAVITDGFRKVKGTWVKTLNVEGHQYYVGHSYTEEDFK